LGGGQGGEMTQTLYAHMNNLKKKEIKWKKKLLMVSKHTYQRNLKEAQH
jgi:hypothetical protein